MKYVLRRDLINLRMVAGNEKKYSKAIIDGVLKEWVGFGWIELRPASERDKKVYPTVVDELP